MSILNSKVDLFKESLKETITKIGKCENNNMEILQENISFVQEEVFLAKNNIIKSMMETQTVALKAITNLKEKPQDQHELPNITYQQQIQQEHQGHQQNQQKIQKNLNQSRITIINFKIRDSSNYKKNKTNHKKMGNNNNSSSSNYNIKLGSSNIISNNKKKTITTRTRRTTRWKTTTVISAEIATSNLAAATSTTKARTTTTTATTKAT